jgi:FlaA1/EpsC-like NDP-sugar epimerase
MPNRFLKLAIGLRISDFRKMLLNTQPSPATNSASPKRSFRLLFGRWPIDRLVRRLSLILLYAGVLALCLWAAYQIRFDFDVPEESQVGLERNWHWQILLQILFLLLAGQFSGIYRYFSIPDMQRLAYAMFVSGSALYFIRFVDNALSPPRGVILVQCMVSFLALGGIRTAWRLAYEKYYSRKDRVCSRERAMAIVGAGDAGASLIGDLRAHPRLGLLPVALFDDDSKKWHAHIHGIRVVGPPEFIPRARREIGFEEVIIAMPSAAPKRLAEIVGLLQKSRIKYVTVPGIDQLTAGSVSISQVRPVRIEDLLGRDPTNLQLDKIQNVLRDQVVLVTGAGGSIGSELCRQIAAFHPARLLLVEQCEVQIFQIQQELIRFGRGDIILALIADITDQPRMKAILTQYRPTIIFHAAAHKHVLMMELQPGEALKNNTLATATLADLALECGVERLLMISTDKAVNPASVMGASKRLAELYLQALSQRHPDHTKFVAVRFGNVLGSSGSVVPIFEKQIAEGGPVTVTDPEVVRYFMTIPEAVGLVLQSCAQGTGGEVFILDLGKPVKILELARQMIRLSGFEPDRDIKIEFVGLRPGEKLFEELKHLQANCTDTAHPRIKRLTTPPEPLERLRADFARFHVALPTATPEQLRSMMAALLPEYTPYVPPSSRAPSCPGEPETPNPKPEIRNQSALKELGGWEDGKTEGFFAGGD